MAKKPEKEPIQNLPAIQIAGELAHIINKIQDQQGELKEGDLESLQAWTAKLEEKGEAIAFVDSRLASEQAFWQAIAEKAQAEVSKRKRTAENLRKYLLACMQIAGVKQIKHNQGLFCISLVAGRESVIIDNPGALPESMVEIVQEIKPNKAIIKDRLQRLAALQEQAEALVREGKAIPQELAEAIDLEKLEGAHIEIGPDYLQIR